MDRRRPNLWQSAGLLIATLAPRVAHAQIDQRVLAQQLTTGTPTEQRGALERAWTLERHVMGPDLRAALITLLDANNRIVQAAAGSDAALETLVAPEFVVRVAHLVSQLEDPRAIPALAGALGAGSTLVRDALAEFGEAAAAEVLRVVTDSGGRREAISDGLISLRYMVERRAASPLSGSTLVSIRRAALQRLGGVQYFTTLWRAIDLAVILEDPDLRRIVASLSKDRGEIRARGIEDAELQALTQDLAARRLAGARPMPRYRGPAERARLLGRGTSQ